MFGDLGLSGAGWLVLGRFSPGGFFFLSSTLGRAAVGAKTRHRARVNTTTRIGAGGGERRVGTGPVFLLSPVSAAVCVCFSLAPAVLLETPSKLPKTLKKKVGNDVGYPGPLSQHLWIATPTCFRGRSPTSMLAQSWREKISGIFVLCDRHPGCSHLVILALSTAPNGSGGSIRIQRHVSSTYCPGPWVVVL